jgi:hypothetical protein
MKQIKTICHASTEIFDNEVNAALTDGWTLVNRYTLPSEYFVAELEREVITEAERTCDNCRYRDQEENMEPCRNCSKDADKWEAEL